MRAYADSSFLVKLLSQEPDSSLAVGEYRRLGRPPLFFLPLHALEVRNGIYHRAFHRRAARGSGERQHVFREKSAALSRLDQMLERRAFLSVLLEWDAAIDEARRLSETYTERTGARAFDILHVAFALELECELMFTTDERQAKIAKAEGLKIVTVSS